MRALSRSMVATALIAVLPVAIVWTLWVLGVISSPWIAAALAVALLLLASLIGGEIWKRRAATGDVLFSDLLLWGWLRRMRAERRVDDTVERLQEPGSQDGAAKAQLLRQLAAALDAEDPYLDGHSHRVARYSAAMARRLGVEEGESERIRTAAAVHDVGKLHVPPEVLAKPGRLTAEEQQAVRRHAEQGAAMVASLGDPALTAIVRHHHERFDGGGYPAGLQGLAIPLGARIVAVADTFDAVTSARPYRPAGTHKRALDVLAAGAGTQLDPVVVRAFMAEYARRRGLALWALLTLPIAKARHSVLPAGVVVGGIVIFAAIGTVTRIGTTTVTPRVPPQRAAAAAATVHLVSPSAARPRAAHRAAAHHHARARAAAVASTPRSRPARAATSTAAVPAASPARRAAVTPAPRAAAGPRPAGTPRPKPPATPRPTATPRAPAPPATATPAPASTTADQCKQGGWVALGYTNQGQCVSAAHHP
jgi:putative nucleotidyltransferase with HDIG domain